MAGCACNLAAELKRCDTTKTAVYLCEYICQVRAARILDFRYYAREKIRQLLSGGRSCSEIVQILKSEGIVTCRQTVWRLEKHINAHDTIIPLPKPGRPTKITDYVLQKVDEAMTQDDETTAKELVTALRTGGISLSEFTALKARRSLGWTTRGT